MHQPRILSRAESLLRLPGSGATNLAAGNGQWHELAPRFDDERFEINGLAITLAGKDLLANLQDFCGSSGILEIGSHLFDGYSSRRDLLATAPIVIGSGQDWKRGTHRNTRADPEAGQLVDGSPRVALRGEPELLALLAPSQAVWESEEIALRYGSRVLALSWDAALLRDASAGTVGAPVIELRTGAPGNLGALAYTPVASTPAQADAGHVDLATPAAGTAMQLRVTLPYVASDAAAPARDTLLRTASLFSLCAWIALDRPRWRFENVAELIERSEFGRHEAPRGWQATGDALILRVPLNTVLRGNHGERLMARIKGGGLQHLEVQAVTDLRLDPTRR
ncbi:MAG: hypothetical protein KIS73_22790 [Enhydrobacter sp.]|nr:hypothetical protein [Enhydrobacter sp.]